MRIALLSLFVVPVVAVAACGGGTDDTQRPAGERPDASADASAAPDGSDTAIDASSDAAPIGDPNDPYAKCGPAGPRSPDDGSGGGGSTPLDGGGVKCELLRAGGLSLSCDGTTCTCTIRQTTVTFAQDTTCSHVPSDVSAIEAICASHCP